MATSCLSESLLTGWVLSILHAACLLCESGTTCSLSVCACYMQVDLPEDPAVKEMLSHKPAYGAVTTPKADANGKDGEINALRPGASDADNHQQLPWSESREEALASR